MHYVHARKNCDPDRNQHDHLRFSLTDRSSCRVEHHVTVDGPGLHHMACDATPRHRPWTRRSTARRPGRDARLHAPLVGEIAQTSADMLFT
ncbi:hypothetical protein [Streptomyces sp. NPDC029674]|uniref:hypothetical protein n=1 Tax=Streptomyces sp. NPDC029674 TaxID=3365297 RepID=UPI00384EF25A